MNKKEKGAWIVHHAKKLSDFKRTNFQEVESSGKAGLFLSTLAASNEQKTLTPAAVQAIVEMHDLKNFEARAIKDLLKEHQLIDESQSGAISVLGVTTGAILGHTTDMFDAAQASPIEHAVLDLSNNVSEAPKSERRLKELIADTHKLSKQENITLFSQAEDAGLIDYETLENEKLYFNGNLFRREYSKKAEAIMSTLSPADISKINEVDAHLTKSGCIEEAKAKRILGDQLLAKLHAIGLYDFNELGNNAGTTLLLTKPSAFGKYGQPFREDAFDLAKAFVSALYYGMNISPSNRGRIWGISLLMKKLIAGERVGPAPAIGQDYRLLEVEGVVQITIENGRYFMRLLKKDIGELALQVLEDGAATDSTIIGTLPPGSMTNYKGPEQTRQLGRKELLPSAKMDVGNTLRTLRINL
ncbi:MAG: hypothetical protein ABWZ25_10015 [Chitinophagaceae bacterium]